ncbi:MAG: PSD1 and planctomycete cytochrome C domain-containing protein [Gemmataceae bacterium]
MKRLIFVAGSLLFLATLPRAADKQIDMAKLPPAAKGDVDFKRDIQPLLTRACVRCHGVDKQKGGLRLDIGSEALKGGNSGPVVKPKDLHSKLLVAVSGLDDEARMPPSGKLLTSEEVGKIRAWIELGAIVPKEEPVATTKTTSDHWAFQPIKQPAIPKVAGEEGLVRNPIDHFILARLEKEKIAPNPEADRATLIRRLSLDLLGLPPSPEEVDAFLNDKSPDAYEKLVDRLLASPHYGERWARHWLDLARYADSDGYEKDTGRPFAWRYRQWVIEALNRDLPFDQFTIEQLAGDLLPAATTEQKVATGFHRNTLTNREGGVDREQFRVEALVDRVSTTAKVWLGITLNCSQCHDHKYDPFSQREFYQFLAFFNSDNEVDIDAPLPGEAEALARELKEFQKKLDALKKKVTEQRKRLPALQVKWEESLKPGAVQKLPPAIGVILAIERDKRNSKQQKELADFFAKQDVELGQLTKAVADFEKKAPKPVKAQTLAMGGLRKTHVMIRGDFLRKGVEVSAGTPGVLTAFAPCKKDAPTRLDLARWLVDPANPLTSRVTANWVWHKFFGRGIVSTLEDFGTRGEKPSHPELLDWLALELQKGKWSLKHLHRTIVTSATYRQSSKARPVLAVRDPYNDLLARQQRLRL